MDWFILLGLVFALAGLYILWRGIQAILRGRASHQWASTTGKILFTQIENHKSDEGNTTFKFLISYEYSLAGDYYVSDRYNAEGTSELNSYAKVQRIAVNYKPGDMVTVYYDPDDPGESLLVQGIPSSIWIRLAGGAIFLGVGIYVIWST